MWYLVFGGLRAGPGGPGPSEWPTLWGLVTVGEGRHCGSRLPAAPACSVPKAHCCPQTDVLFPALSTVLSSFPEWWVEKRL